MKFRGAVPERGEFSIHNIPFGVYSTSSIQPRCATAIGGYVLDLQKFAEDGHLQNVNDNMYDFVSIFSKPALNSFASLPKSLRSAVRQRIISELKKGSINDDCFHSMAEVSMCLPMQIGDFTDFYCSLEHTKNCSNNMVPPNWYMIPSCYNSRVSSIVPSGHPIRRPRGVFPHTTTDEVKYAPTEQLDYELEMGFFISQPVNYGKTLDIANASDHIFGFVLLNDWSSRDIQWYERVPLGPFHGKGFGTTISPWVVTTDALEAFQCTSTLEMENKPLPHLDWPHPAKATFDINLSVDLERQDNTYRLSQSNLKYLHWTPYQQITHHASANCGLNTGDLLGTGTISGTGLDKDGRKAQLGCLFESFRMNYDQLSTKDGKKVTFLHDGDTITFQGWCGGPSVKDCVLGFGECAGLIIPAEGQTN